LTEAEKKELLKKQQESEDDDRTREFIESKRMKYRHMDVIEAELKKHNAKYASLGKSVDTKKGDLFDIKKKSSL
jgi:aspartyl aminopeptidase